MPENWTSSLPRLTRRLSTFWPLHPSNCQRLFHKRTQVCLPTERPLWGPRVAARTVQLFVMGATGKHPKLVFCPSLHLASPWGDLHGCLGIYTNYLLITSHSKQNPFLRLDANKITLQYPDTDHQLSHHDTNHQRQHIQAIPIFSAGQSWCELESWEHLKTFSTRMHQSIVDVVYFWDCTSSKEPCCCTFFLSFIYQMKKKCKTCIC